MKPIFINSILLLSRRILSRGENTSIIIFNKSSFVKEFSMQSVVFAQELSKINNAEKPIEKQEAGKMNPFFEYVSTSKASA